MQSQIREHVEAGSAIFTDELLSYDGLSEDYKHAIINHAIEYANCNVHTNGMENFWSLVKRQLHGTYISVEPFHLFRYIDEQAFRFNNRKMTDAERFDVGVREIVGKRLTYEELIGKTSESETIHETGTLRKARTYSEEGLRICFGPRRFGLAATFFLYARSRRTSVECGTESTSFTPLSNC